MRRVTTPCKNIINFIKKNPGSCRSTIYENLNRYSTKLIYDLLYQCVLNNILLKSDDKFKPLYSFNENFSDDNFSKEKSQKTMGSAFDNVINFIRQNPGMSNSDIFNSLNQYRRSTVYCCLCKGLRNNILLKLYDKNTPVYFLNDSTPRCNNLKETPPKPKKSLKETSFLKQKCIRRKQNEYTITVPPNAINSVFALAQFYERV